MIVTALLKLADWLKEWFQRPSLQIDCRTGPPWAVATKVRIEGIEPIALVSKGVVHYFRVSVKNTGQTTAKACRLKLQRLWFVERGLWQELTKWQPVNLTWSGQPDMVDRNLSPHEQEFCNLGYVPSEYLHSNVMNKNRRVLSIKGPEPGLGPGYFYLDVQPSLDSYANAVPAGTYAFEVSAFSENGPTARAFLEMWFPGDHATMIDEFVKGEPISGVQIVVRESQPVVGSTARPDLSGVFRTS